MRKKGRWVSNSHLSAHCPVEPADVAARIIIVELELVWQIIPSTPRSKSYFSN